MTVKTPGTSASTEASPTVPQELSQTNPVHGWAAFVKGWNAFWDSFASLRWYDAFIEFLFRFTAKTSEPLLAIGIIYSAAIILSEGALTSHNPLFDGFWAITQAIAIESSGGVVLVYGLQSLRDRDNVKAILYLILSALLAITGGIMLFMHMADWQRPRDDPFMLALFALRCVVSVGYIYLCRTKHIRFRDLTSRPDEQSVGQNVAKPIEQPTASAVEIDYERLADALLPRLQPMLMAQRTTVTEDVQPMPALEQPQEPEVVTVSEIAARSAARPKTEVSARQVASPKAEAPASTKVDAEQERYARLEQSYQELLKKADGKRISGKALAEHSHVSRATCTTWLRSHHPENEEHVVQRSDKPRREARVSASLGTKPEEKPVPEWALVQDGDQVSHLDGMAPEAQRESQTEEIALITLPESR